MSIKRWINDLAFIYFPLFIAFSVEGYDPQDLTHKTGEWKFNKTKSVDYFKAFKKRWKFQKT